MSYVLTKSGVELTGLQPAGIRILAALDGVAVQLQTPMTVTCGCEAHPATDPHTRGVALDIRTHGLPPGMKDDVLHRLLRALNEADAAIVPVGIGFATSLFYAQLEYRDQPNEHIHCQLRQGRVFPQPPPNTPTRTDV